MGLNGFEPLTSPLSGVRSNQLSYRPKHKSPDKANLKGAQSHDHKHDTDKQKGEGAMPSPTKRRLRSRFCYVLCARVIDFLGAMHPDNRTGRRRSLRNGNQGVGPT